MHFLHQASYATPPSHTWFNILRCTFHIVEMDRNCLYTVYRISVLPEHR